MTEPGPAVASAWSGSAGRFGVAPVGALGRLAAGLVAVGCLAVLVVAAWLSPSAAGHGTHRQMGLPPCGWVVAFGKPCPTCGMTTAFSEAVHLHPVRSLAAQPMGFVASLAAGCAVWAGLHVALTGSRLGRVCATMMTPRVLWILGGLWMASWGYKLLTWNG